MQMTQNDEQKKSTKTLNLKTNPLDLSILSSKTLKSGRRIPVIGYGTYQLKGEQCLEGLKQALKMGYRHIDTASIYKNESEIKKVLMEFKGRIERKDLFITSKIAPTEQGYENAKKAAYGIIQKLDCQYLDLLLIHWPAISKKPVDDPINAAVRLQTWKALLELKKEGKVRDIGVSNFLRRHIQHLMKNYPKKEEQPSVNQIEIHPLLYMEKTIEFCKENGIILQAYSPLARGSEELFKDKNMVQLSEKYQKSIAQLSLRYLLQKGMVILPKSKAELRIKQNMNLFDFSIQQKDMGLIDLLNAKNMHTCWNPHQIKY